MPTKDRREDAIVETFLAGYEQCSWATVKVTFPDKEIDGGVDGLATRADGATLAVEHTLIQPFVGEKEDFAFFSAAFFEIENDELLRVPGRNINVFVPVGTLAGHPEKSVRSEMVRSVHEHLRERVALFPEGWSDSHCEMRNGGQLLSELILRVRVLSSDRITGLTLVRRQQTVDNLSDVIDRAVQAKVPKLAATVAAKRVLLLEREHMNLMPLRIVQEIDRCRTVCDDFSSIDEVWIVETMGISDDYLRFERYHDSQLVSSLDFQGGELISSWEDPQFHLESGWSRG